jgi:hypothetical protein
VGQQIEITLGTVGPQKYGAPQVSSPVIRLESVALAVPPNPGGPTHVYIFETTADGEAQIKIPIINSEYPDWTKRLTFAVTIHIGSAAGIPPAQHASMTSDQANTEPWKNAWTNLLNDVRQTFTPSLPRLTGVEVELVVVNPGPSDDEVTMNLGNAAGDVLADVSKTVLVADCRHVLFVFPNGGLRVSPGQVYSIRLSGGSVFGWKYVVGGYASGVASLNGRPLLPDTRSTFLFRTFGANGAPVAGGERAIYFGAFRTRHGLTTVWTAALRARRKECEEESGSSRGAQVGGVTAPALGDGRGV